MCSLIFLFQTISWAARIFPDEPLVPIVLDAILDQFSSLYVGQTVGEWLFDGFNEGVIDWLFEVIESGDLPIETLPVEIPFDK